MSTQTKRKSKRRDAGEPRRAETAESPPVTEPSTEPFSSEVPETETTRHDDVTLEEVKQDEAVVERVEHLAKEVGWILVTAGVVGIIMPGVLGTPFLIAGAAALWPGNHERFQRWREGHSPKFFHGSMKQINRFLDDLERRYPKNGRR